MKSVFGYLIIVLCCIITISCSSNKQQKMYRTNHSVIKMNDDKMRNIKVLLQYDNYYNQLDKYDKIETLYNDYLKLKIENTAVKSFRDGLLLGLEIK